MKKLLLLDTLRSAVYSSTFMCTSLFMIAIQSFNSMAQGPEILHYRFSESGTTVTNLASAPPVGTETATIMGGLTQGGTGQCGGALIGTGIAASTDYVNSNYAPAIGTGSWTISMWTSNISASTTLFYIFGDANTNSFRCFTNGVAGANNWILRGAGLTDILINGGATVAPHVSTFVYDQPTNSVYAYLDGVLVSTVVQTGPNLTGVGPLKVMGYGSNVGAPAGGLLDEYRLYSRALSALEVAALMDGETTVNLTINECNDVVSPSGNYTYTMSGIYNDTIVGGVGECDSVFTLDVTINTPVLAGATSASQICAGDSVIVYGLNGSAYNWTSGVLDSVAFFPVMSETYYLDGVDTNGCAGIDSVYILVNPTSDVTLTESAMDIYTLNGIDYTATGIYTQVLQNEYGCDSIITLDLTVSHAGIEELITNYNVAPNPAQDELIVSSTIPSNINYSIVDAQGKIILNGKLQGFSTSINIEELVKGIYLLNIEDKQGVIRFVKN